MKCVTNKHSRSVVQFGERILETNDERVFPSSELTV